MDVHTVGLTESDKCNPYNCILYLFLVCYIDGIVII